MSGEACIKDYLAGVTCTLKVFEFKNKNSRPWKLQLVLESPWISVLSLSNPDSQVPNVEEKEETQKNLQGKIAHGVKIKKDIKSLALFFCTEWSPWTMEMCPWIFVPKKEQTRLIYLCVCYRDALSAANLSSLVKGQSAILAKLVADIICKQDHKLCHLLPPPNTCAEYLWIAHKFRMPMYV